MRLLLVSILLLLSETALAEFRVWCESPDGSRHWSPEERSGVRDCGDGIKHVSNVPPGCIDGGHFDFLNCRMPTGTTRQRVMQEQQLASNDSAPVTPPPAPPRPSNDLSGAIINIMEHTRTRDELIEELSLD